MELNMEFALDLEAMMNGLVDEDPQPDYERLNDLIETAWLKHFGAEDIEPHIYKINLVMITALSVRCQNECNRITEMHGSQEVVLPIQEGDPMDVYRIVMKLVTTATTENQSFEVTVHEYQNIVEEMKQVPNFGYRLFDLTRDLARVPTPGLN